MHTKDLIKFSLLFSILILALVILFQQLLIIETVNNLSVDLNSVKANSAQKPAQYNPEISAEPAITNTVTVRGVIKKEKVPEELQLGDYWYWFYFDEPYLLTENASGYPQYIDKIQVLPPQNKDFSGIESYLNKHVEIYGSKTWGYAESNVFQLIAITVL